ncbi:MAG: DEAD/DEAH box helicase [Syntrophales bacterium]|nr:DEAD/DEAH box helicase [Syntrophales bacterium]
MDHQGGVPDQFHPLIRKWFTERLGAPTDIQSRVWPEIAKGRHVLATAPTGSGKTLTAFLWAINQLVAGVWGSGQTRVLYVSPLKALNNDIRRNLTTPLEELKSCFLEAGEDFPEICVLTRSGDTPAEERRRMVRRPPEILITTPESLNILLSSRAGQAMLTGIATVILDEIHAVVGTKRGTHLITAVERLVRISGEFQRIALSATVKPLLKVADFIGGSIQKGDQYKKRDVAIIQSREKKSYEIRVSFPPDAREQLVDASWWPVLAQSFRKIIRENRSTLLFANSRRTAEKVTRLINEGEPEELAYSHHGSLSREIRLAVEQRLKKGELKAIVATSSLELGIDIGDLDQVILIQTPPSIASAIQRIGRSGHSVGGMSRGLLYPTHGHDFLCAAVVARGVTEQDIESVLPIECPLDILAQVIVSMTGIERWNIDELYAFLKTCHPYRHLSRRQFDLVLEMLAGRYADTRLRELKPRISLDRIDNTVHGKDGVLRLIYLSGGAIPDRGYYDLRVEETRAKIGELDEEFVWERRVGDTFTLGTQVWRIRKVTHNDVEVLPVEVKPGIFPFWRAEDLNRDFHFSEKILLFLEEFNNRLEALSLKEELRRDYFLDDMAADELIGHLKRQREATGTDLPHRHHLLIEHFDDPLNTSDRKQVILHTLWGGRINRPFGLALQAAWEEKYNTHLEVIENNDCILLMLPHAFSAAGLFTLVHPENIERLLRKTLETSGFFGAKFRENAGRALLLPRADFKRRLPLWLNRLRAKKLMDAVLPYPDFPILLETWRTCLQDEFDLGHLKQLLDEVRSGRIKITETTTTTASPFCHGLIWKQTNTYMYEDDTPGSGKASRLSQELIKEVLFSSRLRPRIPEALIASLTAKLQRTAPGYAPRSADDLLDWVKERLFIPAAEWQTLLEAIQRDGEMAVTEATAAIREKIVAIRLPRTSVFGVCALENLARIAGAFQTRPGELVAGDILSNQVLGDSIPLLVTPGAEMFDISTVDQSLVGNVSPPAGIIDRIGSIYQEETQGESTLRDIMIQWLSFYGPLRKSSLKEIFGLDESLLDDILTGLAESQDVILDLLTENAEQIEVCDRENLEILLRMARKSRRPSFRALPVDHLPLFLAAYQGLTSPGDSMDDLQNRLDQLFGFPAPAEAWEKHLLPARLSPYYSAWLDTLMQTSGLIWFGCGSRKISFSFSDDLELFIEQERDGGDAGASEEQVPPDELSGLLPEKIGRYSFFDIARHANMDSRAVTERLWRLAWQGRVTNDAFATVRKGILTDFAPFSLKQERGRPSRSGYNRWTASRPLSGNWYTIDREGMNKDSIDDMELVKDRVRQLFKRYGLLFRELLANELPLLQWAKTFKALRLMELSGEILSGYFFEGIPGVQFISHEAFRFLNEPLPEESIYWLNAGDPASLCGIRLEALKGSLPSRIPSTHMVYHGKRPVLISRRNGSILEFLVSPDDPHIRDYLYFFKVLLTREFQPEKMILVETINEKPALESEYSGALRDCGFTGYYKGLELERKY